MRSTLNKVLSVIYFVVVQLVSCDHLCDPMDRGTPGFPALHYLPALTQTHVR